MASEIDDLMSLDPLQLSAQDIEDIVAYQRRTRKDFEAGVKPKKDTGPEKKVSLEGLGLVKSPAVGFKRRV